MIPGIKYYSFYEKSGYADAAHAYLNALSALGIPVSWHPLQIGESGNYEPLSVAPADLADHPTLQPLFRADIAYDVVLLHVIPEYYERCLARETGKFIVAYSTWETDTQPASWLPLLALAHLILVPCQWNRDVYEKAGCTVPIRVVPHGFNPPRPTTAPLNLPGVRPSDFVFYSIAVWTSRKNNELLVEAFLRAFTADDPVILVLKTTRHNERLRRRGKLQSRLSRWFRTSRQAVRLLRRQHASPARVTLLDKPVSAAHIEALHQRGDAYVSLAHAEGWGLGAFDAAGRDKPVMMTGYGGPRDFLPADLAHLVDYDLVPVSVGPTENSCTYRHDHLWAQPDLEHAVRTFKKIHAQRHACAATGRELGTFVRTHFASDKIARAFITAIDQTRSATPPQPASTLPCLPAPSMTPPSAPVKPKINPLRLFYKMTRARLLEGRQSASYQTKYRRWKFRGVTNRFTARTPDEAWNILYRIPQEDEYGIAHERFARSDVIIDIGAHIGVFSYMAHVMGSRKIHAFEADPANHALLKKNLHDLPAVQVAYNAVGRSDADAPSHVIHSGYINENTGGGNVIMRGHPFEFWKQELFDSPPAAAETRIPTIRLDDILARFKKIKLIKIDCEGSEFPILLTSQLLGRVERIIGEYHEIEPALMPHLDPGAIIPGYIEYRKEHLADALQKHGFTVTFKPAARCIGLFTATRPSPT